jgi:hypothetical protein
MSGVHAHKRISTEAHPGASALSLDIQAMQDVLYDILANGVDPDRAEIPTQEVECFLFEHARAPKSREEFYAFFEKHGLTLGRRRAPAPIALPPIERVPERDMPPRLPVELSAFAERAPDPWAGEEVTGARLRRPAKLGLWAALAGAAVLIAAAGVYGYSTVSDLRGELERTARASRDNQRALDALRDHAADLESNIAATGELVQRMDQKSDLIVESLTAAQDRARPAKRPFAK